MRYNKIDIVVHNVRTVRNDMQLLKDINYKKMITNRIMVTGIMILLEFALLIALFWRAIRYSGWIFGAFYLLSILYV